MQSHRQSQVPGEGDGAHRELQYLLRGAPERSAVLAVSDYAILGWALQGSRLALFSGSSGLVVFGVVRQVIEFPQLCFYWSHGKTEA